MGHWHFLIHPNTLIRKLQSWAWVKNFLIIWVGFLSQFRISYGFLRRILAMHTQVVSVSQHAGWFGAPCCRSTLPDQFFPRLFYDFQWIPADSPYISADFPLIFYGFSRIVHGFPWIFHRIPRRPLPFLGQDFFPKTRVRNSDSCVNISYLKNSYQWVWV